MEYLKGPSVKEVKVRLKRNIYEKLKELQILEDKSFNKLINDLLEDLLFKKAYKRFNPQYFFSEKPKLAFNEANIQIYYNNFITVDLHKYKDLIDLIVTSPPYNVAIEYGKHKDDTSYEEYLKFTELWLKKSFFLIERRRKSMFKHTLGQKQKWLKTCIC